MVLSVNGQQTVKLRSFCKNSIVKAGFQLKTTLSRLLCFRLFLLSKTRRFFTQVQISWKSLMEELEVLYVHLRVDILLEQTLEKLLTFGAKCKITCREINPQHLRHCKHLIILFQPSLVLSMMDAQLLEIAVTHLLAISI